MKRKNALRILIVDSENDALLIIRELEKGGYHPFTERVDAVTGMKKALLEKQWDIILCEYQLPEFNASPAIAFLQEVSLDVPVIVISGSVKEETAAACMRLGAKDCIIKPHYFRLCPAVDRELKAAEVRNQLRRAEKKFFSLFHLNPDPMSITGIATGEIVDVNALFVQWSGYSREEIIGVSGNDLRFWVNPSDREEIITALNKREEVKGKEVAVRQKKGEIRNLLLSCQFIEIEQKSYLLTIGHDITERKMAEEKYRNIFENAQEGIFQSTPEGKIILANLSMARIFGYESPEDIVAGVTDLARQVYVDPEERIKVGKMMEEQGFICNVETRFRRKDGRIIWASITMIPVRDDKGEIRHYEGILEDVTDRKENVERLRRTLGATVQAIASMVEARDPYTAGHQRRVSDLARTIAAEMNLSHDRIEGLRVAAVIHDIGKLSVPAEILSKPTRLTNLEFGLIRNHAQAGYDILKDIEFPWPVARTVVEHHERLDGSGYPNGLTGEKLLLESRILAVADVVEAMASHRPYRASLGIEPALEEIERNKGILYDHLVADACLKLFREKSYQL